jgi:hypothetical protein
MKILLVEDENRIADPLAEDLRHQSHQKPPPQTQTSWLSNRYNRNSIWSW